MSQDEEQFILSQKSDWNKRRKNNVHIFIVQTAHSFALEFSFFDLNESMDFF